jgi:hypothetical protein
LLEILQFLIFFALIYFWSDLVEIKISNKTTLEMQMQEMSALKLHVCPLAEHRNATG